MSEKTFRNVVFGLALTHLSAFTLYSLLPIDHAFIPKGNWWADSVAAPVGALTLMGLVLVGIVGKFLPQSTASGEKVKP